MVGKTGACEECARTCQLLHWSKKDLEPRVTRFFKIMIGPDFNEALFLPPKFAKGVKDLVDQETKLEDSSGICWTVTLSYYKDLLAFHKGWSEFSVDKDLKMGDFLVVNYIKGGHFVVHAFGKDGCEKLNVARKHPPVKRAQTSENITAENTPCQTTCKDGRKRKSPSTSVQIQPLKTNCTSYCEGGNKKQLHMDNEFYLMVDRDAGYVQSDYRTCLYDLSSFEIQQNMCFAGKNKKHIDGQEGNPDHAQTSLKFQADGDLVDKNPIETVALSMETATARNTDVVENNKDLGPIGNMSFECDKVLSDGLSNDLPSAAASVKHADNCIKGDDISNIAILPQSPKRSTRNLPASPQSCSRNLNKEIEMVKKDKVEMREQASGCGRKRGKQASDCGRKRALEPSTREEGGNSFAAPGMIKVVKIEPVDSLDVPSTVATGFTCLAETNGCVYIDLPDCLPSVTFPRDKQGRASVILEDPEGREWLGIYHDKFGFRVLVAPWHKVNAENGIQPGDCLVFSVADASLNKYKFDIVRKQLEN